MSAWDLWRSGSIDSDGVIEIVSEHSVAYLKQLAIDARTFAMAVDQAIYRHSTKERGKADENA